MKTDSKESEYKNIGLRDYNFAIFENDTDKKKTPYLDLLLRLWHGDWLDQLQKMNNAIKHFNVHQGPSRSRDVKTFSPREWWKCHGVMIAAPGVGMGGWSLFGKQKKRKDEKLRRSLTPEINISKFGISNTRFDTFRRFYADAFGDEEARKRGDPWWKMMGLEKGFNENRKRLVAASAIKTLDELMSAIRPRTKATGDLPHLSFILRKPEPLGTEFKCVACAETGVLLFVEVQRGKRGMLESKFQKEFGATSACTLRLVQGTKNTGQSIRHSNNVRQIYLGDSWFSGCKTARLVAEYEGVEWIGPVKTNKAGFPMSTLENKMKEWPGGTYLVLETVGEVTPLVAIGYKYNSRKCLSFVTTKKAGTTIPGEPYYAKFNDIHANILHRPVVRPSVLSTYFHRSNKVDTHNHSRQNTLKLEKWWVTQSGYFRIATTFLGITVTDAWKCFCHGVKRSHEDKDIGIIEFSERLAYDCLNNNFTTDFGTPSRNLPAMTPQSICSTNVTATTREERTRPRKKLKMTSLKTSKTDNVKDTSTISSPGKILRSRRIVKKHSLKKTPKSRVDKDGKRIQQKRGLCCFRLGNGSKCGGKTAYYCVDCSNESIDLYMWLCPEQKRQCFALHDQNPS